MRYTHEVFIFNLRNEDLGLYGLDQCTNAACRFTDSTNWTPFKILLYFMTICHILDISQGFEVC